MTPPIIVTLFLTPICESVARLLQADLVQAHFQKFSDSECAVSIDNPEHFLGKDVYIFQSTGTPVNDTVLGVAFLAQQLKQAGARKIVLINPYFGYSRQDKGVIAGQPGHVEIIARLFEASGIDELITVELHNPAIKNYFTIPIHELSLTDALAEYIKQHFGSRKEMCLIAPDKGAYERVAKIGLLVGAGVLVFSKERYAADKTRVVGVSGTCSGKTAILIDDIIDTAGTAINAAQALMELQFHEVIGFFVHPVLSGDACERIEKSPFAQIIVSNTLPVPGDHRKIVPLDISGVLAEFIWKMR
jgi:ribose-phosphate pyrophosphokinase